MMLAARRAAAEWRPAPSGSKFSMAPSQYLPLLGPGVLALEPSAKASPQVVLTRAVPQSWSVCTTGAP